MNELLFLLVPGVVLWAYSRLAFYYAYSEKDGGTAGKAR